MHNMEYGSILHLPHYCTSKESICELPDRTPDPSVVAGASSDIAYSVFVSYVEIYNNYIYDLLDDQQVDQKLSSKILREDSSRTAFVMGVVESEVKSADEALMLFHKGQQRRRVANTALNTESSRSHSIFTIRLVQAPVEAVKSAVLRDNVLVQVSQLSLVDLAGSERLTRMMSTSSTMRETGNINSSLMTLRSCIEALRGSESQSTPKIVPYRESKLTHMFKSFFEGRGKIRMIVCVNPRGDYYNETVHVLKFSDMAQEVLISRAPPMTVGSIYGLLPGREMYRNAMNEIRDLEDADSGNSSPDSDVLVENAEQALENFKIIEQNVEALVTKKVQELLACKDGYLEQALIERDREIKSLRLEIQSKVTDSNQVQVEHNIKSALQELEIQSLKQELESLKAGFGQAKAEQDQRLALQESEINSLKQEQEQRLALQESEVNSLKQQQDQRLASQASENNSLMRELEGRLEKGLTRIQLERVHAAVELEERRRVMRFGEHMNHAKERFDQYVAERELQLTRHEELVKAVVEMKTQMQFILEKVSHIEDKSEKDEYLFAEHEEACVKRLDVFHKNLASEEEERIKQFNLLKDELESTKVELVELSVDIAPFDCALGQAPAFIELKELMVDHKLTFDKQKEDFKAFSVQIDEQEHALFTLQEQVDAIKKKSLEEDEALSKWIEDQKQFMNILRIVLEQIVSAISRSSGWQSSEFLVDLAMSLDKISDFAESM